MTNAGIIGDQGKLPWEIKEDLINFRNWTIGNTVIMGRKTYDSIITALQKPLPNRINIVVTRTLDSLPDQVITCSGLEVAIKSAEQFTDKEIFIIGGAQIYQVALPLADRLIVSWIKHPYSGDTKFPININEAANWVIDQHQSFEEFDLNIYSRKIK